MDMLPPPPVPLRPDLAAAEPPPRRRFRPWAVVVSALLALSLAVAAVVPFLSGAGSEAASGFVFLAQNDGGRPVRWNPCEAIHYVVNASLAPPGSIEDVHEAVRRISAATGIVFVYDGLTHEQALSTHRDPFLPSLYGERWAPVLVTWVDPDDSHIPFARGDHLASAVAAPLYPNGAQGEVYVSGWVALNAKDPNAPGFDRIDEQGPVILHELGHVMGLGHVRVRGEIMHAAGGGVIDLGPGDKEGLRRLGASGGCVPVPQARA